jgi:hypothetical protein
MLSISRERLEAFTAAHGALMALFGECESCSAGAEGLTVFHAPLHAAHVVPSEFLAHLAV